MLAARTLGEGVFNRLNTLAPKELRSLGWESEVSTSIWKSEVVDQFRLLAVLF